jgi:hypothetical protein
LCGKVHHWGGNPLTTKGAKRHSCAWMHLHVGMQEQVLMKASLIVEDEMAQREDRQEIVLMLQYVPETGAKS